MTCKWFSLKGDEVESDVQNYKILLNKSKKVFRTKEDTNELITIIDEILQEINNFEKFVPLAVNLRVEGMYSRHWKLLTEKMNKRISPYLEGTDDLDEPIPDDNFTLEYCIQLGCID